MSGDSLQQLLLQVAAGGQRRSGNLCEEEGQGTAMYWTTGTGSDTMGRSLRSCCPRGFHDKGGPDVKNGKQLRQNNC